MKHKNIAIIHDAVLSLGGAERVLFALLELFPRADLFVPIIDPRYNQTIRQKAGGTVYTTFLSRLPGIAGYASFFKPILFWYWEHLDVSRYNLAISSSHSFSSKSVMVPPSTLHISYIHTSPKYLYEEYNETQWIRNRIIRFLIRPMLLWLRKKDYEGAQHPDLLIANSKTVQKRIRNYYHQKSVVIYPPVLIPNVYLSDKDTKKKYFLCVSRLVKQKGVDLAIRACNDLQLPLIIVGTGPEERFLKSIAGPTILFLGFVSDTDMHAVYAKARAFISCAIDEDFGIAVVEAMAHGVSVIAYASGGMRETVVPGKTGILFRTHTMSSLIKALKDFEMFFFHAEACRKQASAFSKNRFIHGIMQIIKTYEKENPLS